MIVKSFAEEIGTPVFSLNMEFVIFPPVPVHEIALPWFPDTSPFLNVIPVISTLFAFIVNILPLLFASRITLPEPVTFHDLEIVFP